VARTLKAHGVGSSFVEQAAVRASDVCGSLPAVLAEARSRK
jgi:hypothetical protein